MKRFFGQKKSIDPKSIWLKANFKRTCVRNKDRHQQMF